jgi:hypothetical protein
MGYVERASSQPGALVFAEVRGIRHAAFVVPLPFFAHRYRRG